MTKTESKKRIHELYEKHYGKGKRQSPHKKSKAAKTKEVIEQKVKAEQEVTAQKKSQSRNELMLQAKEKGIKNFRILNKEELMKVLAPDATEEVISQVIHGAVARWKSGWGKKGGRPATQTA